MTSTTSDLATPFVWITHRREILRPAQMHTIHLCNAVRFIFNHSVPAQYRVGQFKPWHLGPRFGAKYRREAMKAFLAELSERQDIPDDRVAQIIDMARVESFFRNRPIK